MLKKVSMVVGLSAALLFGGGLSQSVDAAANEEATNNKVEKQPIEKIYYYYNGQWKQGSEKKWNDYLNNCLANFSKDWQKKSHVNQKQKEPVKQLEKPVTEEKKKEETPVQQPVEKTPTQSTEKKQEQSQNGQLNAFEQQVFELTNNERTKQGLKPLQIDYELSKVAREKSRDMAVNGYFDHNSPTYGSPFDMMRSYGITYKTAGENIAKGQRTPEEVVRAWMNSPGHRANILNGQFTHIGVGYVEQGNVWTQQFIGK